MNRLNKVFIMIIFILMILICILTGMHLYWKKIAKNAIYELAQYTEKVNKIEDGYNRKWENVSLEIKKDSLTPNGVNIIIIDNNSNPYYWKNEYKLQIKRNDRWENLDKKYEYSFSIEPIKSNEEGKIEETIDWSKLYGKLEKGTYRIIKYVYTTYELCIESEPFEL